jgi:hypothetical protein
MRSRKVIIMKLQQITLALVRIIGLLAIVVIATSLAQAQAPAIKFTKVPPSGGGPERLETIAGVVSDVDVKACDCRIILYSLTDQYWVQPFAENPYTELRPDNTFEAAIHLGEQYFALLVKKTFRPPARLAKLPEVGGDVIVIAGVKAGQN